MDGVVSGLNWEVFKLPLGFIRIVQLPLVIIAFATAADYKGHFVYTANCSQPVEPFTVEWSYPFNLPTSQVPKNSCDKSKGMTNFFTQPYSSSSQFYVFVGVMSFLWILASGYVYAARWSQYESEPRMAKADLVISAIFAFCWIAGWLAWAVAVDGIKGAVSLENNKALLGERDAACTVAKNEYSEAKCPIDEAKSHWGASHLTISALAGFACVVAAIGNVWFVWKETEWHKLRQTNADLGQIPGATLSGPQTPATPSPANTPGYNGNF